MKSSKKMFIGGILSALTLMAINSNAWSNETKSEVYYIKISCNAGLFEMNSGSETNSDYERMQEQLSDEEKLLTSIGESIHVCKTAGLNVELIVDRAPNSETGTCASVGNIMFTLKVNNQSIIKDQPVNNPCSNSFHSLKIRQDKWEGSVLEVCGENSFLNNPVIYKCLKYGRKEVSHDWLEHFQEAKTANELFPKTVMTNNNAN